MRLVRLLLLLLLLLRLLLLLARDGHCLLPTATASSALRTRRDPNSLPLPLTLYPQP